MRVLIAALVVCLCAWQTHVRARDWRSDQALWAAATVSTPTKPRPFLNLAWAETRAGHLEPAARHLAEALTLADQPAHAAVRPAILGRATWLVTWLDAETLLCDRPAWQRWCAS